MLTEKKLLFQQSDKVGACLSLRTTEWTLINSMVAVYQLRKYQMLRLLIKIYRQINRTITRTGLFYVRKQIKNDSYHWYETMREGEYEYIHEFKERISEILIYRKSIMPL